MTFRTQKVALTAAIALALAACGSDNDNGGGGSAAAVRGTATKTGAGLVVNGVQFPAGTVRFDDNPSANDLAAIQNGMVVEVRGRVSDDGRTGTATEIRFGEDFQGPATNVTATSFTIFGVVVNLDATTAIVNSAGVAQSWPIANGTRVEVSGMPEANGQFRATWVKVEDTGTVDEVKGFVVGAPSGNTFSIALTPGGTPFATVTSATALPAFVVAGAYVEVHGPFTAGTPGTIAATLIQSEDFGDDDRNLRTHVEGLVTSGTSFSSFTIRDVQVNGANATFRGLPEGQTDLASANAEFQLGTKVEAEGTIDANGVLQATRIKLKDGVRLGGVIASGNAAAFVLSGLNVVATGATVEGTPAPSAYVEVRGYRRVNGDIQAQRIRVRDGGGNRDTYVQGVLTLEGPITIMNTIQVPTGTGTEYQDENEVSLGVGEAGRTAFLARTEENRTLVKARWNEGAALTTPAKELEIEAEDD